MDNNYNKNATLDILPEFLFQEILGFLSYEEATRMSILSKTWLQAWSTLPDLKFMTDAHHMKIVDSIMERYRKGKIPIQRFELSDYYAIPPEDFTMINKWIDIALQNGLKNLVLKYYSSYHLTIFTILAANSIRELVVMHCSLIPVSISSSVVDYSSLRKLWLSNVRSDENMLQTLFNNCPVVVSVILEYCERLEKIKSDSLKVLKIRYSKIGEIDALNLVSLEYMGNQIPVLRIARKSSQLEHSIIVLKCRDNVNAAWFCKLRKFLSNSTSWSQVSLYFSKCSEIKMTNLQLHYRGSNLQMNHTSSFPQVEVLNVHIRSQTEECPTFVDALLWSCRPDRLNLFSTSTMFTQFLNRLIYMKNSSHSTSHGKEPLLSQLKEVKVFDVDNQPLELGSGEMAVSSLTDSEGVYFLLD